MFLKTFSVAALATIASAMTLDKSTPTHAGTAPAGSECHFPFTYHGKTYDECTDAGWGKGVEWCYVKTKSGGVSAKWGECPNSKGIPGKVYKKSEKAQPHHTVAFCDGKNSGCKNIAEGDGDCDKDNECAHGLSCGTNNCYNGKGSKFDGTDDCCYDPKKMPASGRFEQTPQEIHENGLGLPIKEPEIKTFPRKTTNLTECEGDCDHDGDCRGELICTQRKYTDAKVSGCQGAPKKYQDYCVNPTLYSTGIKGSKNLNMCEGDCDFNSDCNGNLVCQQLTGGEGVYGSVAGCNGARTKDVDYCVVPSLVVKKGATKNLNQCEGDCDRDSDCTGKMKCMQLSGQGRKVPGCSGLTKLNEDYCYWPKGVVASEHKYNYTYTGPCPFHYC